MDEDLISALAELREEEVLTIVEKKLSTNEDPLKILNDAREAMAIVGKRFADGEYFIPDLVYSGEILKEVTDLVKPKMKGESQVKRLGKVIIATVAGDIHDIGKDIVTFMMDVNGFEVYDLGVDVPAKTIIEKIQESGVSIVGLSGFLTLSYDSMKETIDSIKIAGLRDKIQIMIGGGQINEQIRIYTGADAYGKDAMAAVQIAKGWIGG